MRKFRHLDLSKRLKIEMMLKTKHKIREIAEEIGVHISTIYREIKRGEFEYLTSDLTKKTGYAADLAERKYREHLKEKGPGFKIGNDIELANYIEETIRERKWSPEAVLGHIQSTGKTFQTRICVSTLYSYIDKGLFLTLTNKDLPEKGKKKRKYRKVKVQKRALAGTCIDQRPDEIETREEFGHWEMDTVIGKKGTSKQVLLVLTERKTRMEIIEKIEDKSAASVRTGLNRIERRYGTSLFRQIFQTITVDNGTEFSDVEGLEKSYRGDQKRTKLYYCHPYSSYERGSNEVANKMIRRSIPKGSDIDQKTRTEIKEIEAWMNQYPRGILGYQSAQEVFDREVAALKG